MSVILKGKKNLSKNTLASLAFKAASHVDDQSSRVPEKTDILLNPWPFVSISVADLWNVAKAVPRSATLQPLRSAKLTRSISSPVSVMRRLHQHPFR